MKDTSYIIADNVKLYRKKRKLTQTKLAELADLSVDSIKRIEAGQRSMSLENFLRLAEALEAPLPFLLYELQQVRRQYPQDHSGEAPEVQHGRDSVDE